MCIQADPSPFERWDLLPLADNEAFEEVFDEVGDKDGDEVELGLAVSAEICLANYVDRYN